MIQKNLLTPRSHFNEAFLIVSRLEDTLHRMQLLSHKPAIG